MILKHFFIILVTLLFMGCPSSPINFSKGESLHQDEGLVFGRVKVLVGEKEKKLSLFGESKLAFHTALRARGMLDSAGGALDPTLGQRGTNPL